MIKSDLTIKLLEIAFKLLGYITPASDKKITFMSEPDLSDNAFHFFRYLVKNRKESDFTWIVLDKKKAQLKISQIFPSLNIDIVQKKTFTAIFVLLRSKYIFHTHGTYRFISPTKHRRIVNLWHGMPIKSIGHLDYNLPGPKSRIDRSDNVIATSKFFSYVMACAFDMNHKAVLVTGLPRNDVLLHPNVSRENIFDILGVPNGSNLIMWLPTYRQSESIETRKDSLSDSFLKEIPFTLNELSEELVRDKLFLVIKIHPMDSYSYKKINFPNIKIITSPEWQLLNLDLYDALAQTNVLVSDISSVIFDFMLTGRPILQLNADKHGYCRGETYQFKFTEYKNFHEVNNLDDFVSCTKTQTSLDEAPYIFHSCKAGDACKNIESLIFKTQ